MQQVLTCQEQVLLSYDHVHWERNFFIPFLHGYEPIKVPYTDSNDLTFRHLGQVSKLSQSRVFHMSEN
jgi:hypothetical protein